MRIVLQWRILCIWIGKNLWFSLKNPWMRKMKVHVKQSIKGALAWLRKCIIFDSKNENEEQYRSNLLFENNWRLVEQKIQKKGNHEVINAGLANFLRKTGKWGHSLPFLGISKPFKSGFLFCCYFALVENIYSPLIILSQPL